MPLSMPLLRRLHLRRARSSTRWRCFRWFHCQVGPQFAVLSPERLHPRAFRHCDWVLRGPAKPALQHVAAINFTDTHGNGRVLLPACPAAKLM